MKIQQAKNKYKEAVLPELLKSLGEKSPLAVPRVKKVTVNTGIGKYLKDGAAVDEITSALEEITGQKPVKTKARKAISGFKIRQDLEVGIKVTLRGERMWHFIDRLINTALPRIKDFQGIPLSAIDKRGNLSIGIKEHTVFPEIIAEKVKNVFSFQINVSARAKNEKEGEQLYRLLGFPIKK